MAETRRKFDRDFKEGAVRHGDRPGGESGSIGRLGHAGVTSRMSHD
jgi:hypothetical protein